MSLRIRLTLWYVALVAFTLSLFSLVVYLSLAHAMRSQLDQSLETIAQIMLEELDHIEGRLEPDIDPLPPDLLVAVFNLESELLFVNHEDWKPRPGPDGRVKAFRTVTILGQSWRELSLPVIHDGWYTGHILVMKSEEPLDQLLANLMTFLGLGIPLTTLLAAAGGSFLAGQALQPIDRITRAAAKLQASDLSRRLPTLNTQDELGLLISTFNEMLGRLDAAFQRQRQFTSDAAHELRTPLALILGRTDVTLERERSPEEYRQALGEIRQGGDRLTRLVSKLLALARSENLSLPLERERFDLARLVGDVADSFRPQVQDKGLVLHESLDSVFVEADQTRLTELILNLLDNAVRYTPVPGEIRLATTTERSWACLSVRDTGCGIGQEHLERIFDRFYRVDAARVGEDSAGLGLAICRSIARQHSGELTVQSHPGEGTTFRFCLPKIV